MMAPRVHRSARYVLCATTLGLCACAFRASPLDSALSVGTGKIHVESRADSNVLVVQLTPANTMRAPVGSADGSETPLTPKRHSSGMLRLVINPDDSFEYQLTVYNDDRRIYRAARVYEGDPTDGGRVVATLFSDLSLSSRYIQVRGTATVAALIESREMATRLRQHPSDFVFRLEPRVAAAGALTGSVPAPLR